MKSLKTVINYLDNYLEIDSIKDISWNGLQFEGAQSIKKIVFAVDSGIETFQKAALEKANMVVVHHGIFWKHADPSLNGINKKRFDILNKNNISLYACHLPLDRHKKVGNNATIIKLLGARITEEFSWNNGKNISYIGTFNQKVQLTSIVKKLNTTLNTSCKILPFGEAKIKKFGVVTGSCSYSDIEQAVKLNLDLLVTGEIMDIYHTAKDARINILFAGHHATETTGIKALADHIGKRMNVKTVFLDISTGL